MALKKDSVWKVSSDGCYHDNILLLGDTCNHWEYKQNLLDEDGNYLSWYFQPVFKKLTQVYRDEASGRFWLPKEKLYDKKKLRALIRVNNLAFFNYGYAKAFLAGEETKDKKSLSGLFAEGANFFR